MELGGIIALIAVIPLLIGIPIIYAITMYRLLKGDLKILGMRFSLEPKNLKNRIYTDEIESALVLYSKEMAAIFGTLPEHLLSHFSKMICVVQKGFLSNDSRAKAGLGDGNKDGKADRIIGLAVSATTIKIGILFPDDVVDIPGRVMIDENGKIILSRTAFMYEVHNAIIQQFVNYGTALAESFVKADDKAIQKILGTDERGLKKYLANRAIYDAAFKKLNL